MNNNNFSFSFYFIYTKNKLYPNNYFLTVNNKTSFYIFILKIMRKQFERDSSDDKGPTKGLIH